MVRFSVKVGGDGGQKDSHSKIMKFLQTNTENLNNGDMHKCLHFLDIFVCFLCNYP